MYFFLKCYQKESNQKSEYLLHNIHFKNESAVYNIATNALDLETAHFKLKICLFFNVNNSKPPHICVAARFQTKDCSVNH